MQNASSKLGRTPSSGRLAAAERGILDVAGDLERCLAVPSSNGSPALGLSPRRLAAISTTLQVMSMALACRRGWPPVRARFPYDATEDLPEAVREDAIRKLERWSHEHGDDDPLGTVYEILLGTESIVDDRDGSRSPARGGTRRKASGSFYTPSPLVQFVLDRSLAPVLAAKIAGRSGPLRRHALLSVRVLDPAAGGGRFLVEAARRIAAAAGTTAAARGPALLREVLRTCIYGIEIDPVAAEICRVNLCFASGDPEARPDDFATNVREGDALVGATRAFLAEGIPDEAFRFRPGDDREVCAELRRRNRAERRLFRSTGSSAVTASLADVWCSAFLGAKTRMSATPTTGDLELPRSVIGSDRSPDGRFLHPEFAFPEAFSQGGFDVIVGNPPFLNQLESTTAAERARAAFLRYVSQGAICGYADTSAAFLERCSHWLAAGGRMALIQPHSVLAARDSAGIRASVLRRCALRELWVAGERVFPSASVHVCLPVLERSEERRTVLVRFAGADFRRLPDVDIDRDYLTASRSWAPLAAAAAGIPEIPAFDGQPTLATLADATADFRDQYYGLDGFLIEDSDLRAADRRPDLYPKLVTTGLIDLAECRWGVETTRVLKRRWNAPRIDRQRMAREGALTGWIRDRSRAKIILATQTRVIEAFVDAAGDLVPSLPLITVTPRRAGDLWRVAAAVASPVATAVALARHDGAGMTAGAIKLSASQSLQLPLPCNDSSWQQGAESLEFAHGVMDQPSRKRALRAFGHAMAQSYGLSEPIAAAVEDWWASRLSV